MTQTVGSKSVVQHEASDVDRASKLVSILCPNTHEYRFFVIEGNPVSKARPRFSGKSRRPYSSDKQREAEEYLAWRFKQRFPEPLNGNVAVGCVFYRSSHQRIDVDNMLKHVMDSANEVCWHDDSQVTALMGLIEYDPDRPRTLIVIGNHESTMQREGVRKAKCLYCGKEFEPNLRRGHPKRTKFCSRGCASRSVGEDLRESVNCAVCTKPFRRKTAGQRICSEACRVAAMVERNGKRKVSYCVDCGKQLSKPGYKRCRPCWVASKKS